MRTWSSASDEGNSTGGAPIVLFHDSLGCVELWRDFPERLCRGTGRRVIAYDRLGFGTSDARQGPLRLDFIEDEAKNFFPVLKQQLGIGRFVALGHSVGGGMAAHCAALYPHACEALITVATQAFMEDQTIRGIIVAREQFKDARQIKRLEKYHGGKARWVLDSWTETWLSPEFADWSLGSVLRQVTCPVLALHGTHDEYGSTAQPAMIGELSGGQARVEIIEDAYHVPHRDRPDHIIRVISEFLGVE